MSQKSSCAIAVVGIDIGKNSFHVVGQKWSRGQVEARLTVGWISQWSEIFEDHPHQKIGRPAPALYRCDAPRLRADRQAGMRILINQCRDRQKIYLSWDAASRHISKQLSKCIDLHNATGKSPAVETAPLPSGAQFLNVIESVFSGMARAIIHNSDYKGCHQ